MQGSGCRAQGAGLGVQGAGCRVPSHADTPTTPSAQSGRSGQFSALPCPTCLLALACPALPYLSVSMHPRICPPSRAHTQYLPGLLQQGAQGRLHLGLHGGRGRLQLPATVGGAIVCQ